MFNDSFSETPWQFYYLRYMQQTFHLALN